MNLLLVDYLPESEVQSLTQGDLNALFNRGVSFVKRSLEFGFRDAMDETSPAYGLTDLISARWNMVRRIRFFVVSNRSLSRRVDGIEANSIEEKEVQFNVWDLQRLFQLWASGKGREDIEIDLEDEFGEGLPLLPASVSSDDYRAYLAIIPGTHLASIYDRWGARLLEQNVRVFLQKRGNVNRAINATLVNEPEMFFAFNNGLSATAEDVEIKQTSDGPRITRLKNFQIVNGGQTTASIHALTQDKDHMGNLAKVSVQMKLSIVQPERTIHVVPRISEFANSQNKVTSADFFSNHPFQIRIEDFSRRILFSKADGSVRSNKWFYERARGQYQEQKNRLSGADRKKWELEFPDKQHFSKTDLAKYEMVWHEVPHVVSRGAQYIFKEFADFIDTQWDKNADQFGDGKYREYIAKVIVFKATEHLISHADWYGGGYRANIVAYALSRMAMDLRVSGKSLDFQKIAQNQSVPQGVLEAIDAYAEAAQRIILNPQSGVRNLSAWAKKPDAWTSMKAAKVVPPSSFDVHLIALKEMPSTSVTKSDSGIGAQRAVIEAGPQFWRDVSMWGIKNRYLTEKDMGILKAAINSERKLPTERQCKYLYLLVSRLEKEGLPDAELFLKAANRI